MKKIQTKRTFQDCLRVAKKYQTRGEFSKNERNAYMTAYNNGWLDEICAHMICKNKQRGFWTYDNCQIHALKCKTKTEFINRFPSAYAIASRNGWLNKICFHMVRPTPSRYWTKIRCQAEAFKYNCRQDFFKKSNSAYSAASKKGWLKDICKHMPYKQREPGYWTKENCRTEALKYTSKSDFRRLSSSAYVATKRNGWLKELCSHMVPLKKHPDGTITKEFCKKVAGKYDTKSEFRRNNQTIYNKALKNGWLPSICKHMRYTGNLYSRAIYVYEFSDKLVVRIQARMEIEKGKYRASGVLPKVFQEVEAINFHDEAIRFLNTRVKLQLSQRTYEHYSNVLNKHILPKFGKLNLDQIQIKHAHELIETLQKNNHNSKGINLILGVFKRVLIEATREGRLEKNPLQYLREMKVEAAPDVYMSSDEIQKILEVSKGHYFQTLFIIAINSGLRRGEIAGLCWDKINFSTNLIEVSRIRDRNGLADRTKTVKSRRFIPMNTVVRNHLEAMKKNAKGNLVVTKVDGSEFDVNHLNRDFNKFQKLAGLTQHFRFHDLRHTFASHFMMNGGNIYDLQKILGHSSLEMTQRYAHLAPEHLVQASNVVSFGASFNQTNLRAVNQ